MNKKYCPGLIHLRKKLREMIAYTGAETIRVYDGEDVTKYPVTEKGVIEASEFAPELDGTVYYSVGKLCVMVVYDGPYDDDNAEEIICDTNGAMMDYEEEKDALSNQ